MIDIATPKFSVEISVSNDGQTLWVNVDGICIVRVSDMRKPVVFEQSGLHEYKAPIYGKEAYDT